MNSFNFPPPPPPPPPSSAPPPPPPNQRGGFGNRGTRGRGRGSGGNQRGGYQTGGHQQHQSSFRPPNQAPPASSGYPLPNYPAWMASGAQQPPVNYQATQHMNANPYPMPSYNPPQPQYHNQQPQPQPPMPYYGHGQMQQPMGPPHHAGYPNMNNNMMAPPPVRLGFNAQQQPGPGLHSSPAGGFKRKREQNFTAPHSNPNRNQPKPQATASKLPAAPAVPSFGFQLPPKPPPVEDASSAQKPKKKKRRKNNQLGLTPQGEVHENSDEDVDEEAQFAQSGQPYVMLFSSLFASLIYHSEYKSSTAVNPYN